MPFVLSRLRQIGQDRRPEVYSVNVIAPGFEIDASRLRYQATGPNEFGLRLRGASLINVVGPMKAN